MADTQWTVQIGWSKAPQPAVYGRWLLWGIGGSATLLLMLFLNGMLRRKE